MANLIREGVLDKDPMNRDLKNFLWRVWRELGFSSPSSLQYDFADFLQEGITLPRSVILNAFRGAAKSYVTTTFGVWLLKRDRQEQVLVTSATDKFAGNIATFAWQMVSQFEFLADMKPSTDQRRSALAFDVAGAAAQKDESFAAVGIFGQITGRRASRIIGDDLETPNTSDTEVSRQELRKRTSELAGAILKPGGSIYLLGTAQTEDTIYKEWADEKGYDLRIYPIQYPILSDDPKVDELRKYGTRLAPMITNNLTANPHLAGTSTEPARFTEADILKRRIEWGATEFDRQFKMFMDAGGGRANPLKLRDIPVVSIPKPSAGNPVVYLPSEVEFSPVTAYKVLDLKVDSLNGDSTMYAPLKMDIWIPAEEVVCHIDTSGEGEDETSWSIAAGLGGRIFGLAQGASTDGHTKETLTRIAQDCKDWGARTIEVESNFGGTMFSELLRPILKDLGWDAVVLDIKVGKQQKEKRIVETLEPLITGHRLLLNDSLLRADFEVEYEHVEAAKRRYYRLTYQLSRMTKQKGAVKHDDRADSLTGVAAHFVGVLQRQLQKTLEEGKVRRIEEEVERIIAIRIKQGLPLYGLDRGPPALGRPSMRKKH